jgi:lysophospholipase L1-like esterase
MPRALTLLVALALLACTPEAPPARTASPPATQAATSPAASEAGDPPTTTPKSRVRRRALRYVALGDSLASGMDGIDQGRSYADDYARLLRRRTQRKVVLTNLGVPGMNSTELLDQLRHNNGFRTAVASADIVTWDIGGNDLIEVAVQVSAGTCGGDDGLACLPASRDGFAQRWSDIVDELVTLRRSERVPLQTFTLYQPFATVRGVHVDALLRELEERNAIIRGSHGDQGVQVADVAGAFAEGQPADLIDQDGLHPTAAGHRVIAELLLSLKR